MIAYDTSNLKTDVDKRNYTSLYDIDIFDLKWSCHLQFFGENGYKEMTSLKIHFTHIHMFVKTFCSTLPFGLYVNTYNN